MDFSVDELISFAKFHENDTWTTVRGIAFNYLASPDGITYLTAPGGVRTVTRHSLQKFCEAFKERKYSYAPGAYGDFFHKSYTLPLIRAMLAERNKTMA